MGGDHGAGTDQRIGANGDAAKDGGVGADAGAPLDGRGLEPILAGDKGARIADIGEDGVGSYEHVVAKGDRVIEADIVLDHHPVAYDRAPFHEDVMGELAVAADARAREHDAMLPDAGALAYLSAFGDLGGRVRPIGSHILTAAIRAPATRSTCARVISG